VFIFLLHDGSFKCLMILMHIRFLKIIEFFIVLSLKICVFAVFKSTRMMVHAEAVAHSQCVCTCVCVCVWRMRCLLLNKKQIWP
jgi:hypothetical protein